MNVGSDPANRPPGLRQDAVLGVQALQLIATGAEYRKQALENLSRCEGAGVYDGATPMEAQLCLGDEVVIVGGGNSAGQAAMFLAQTTRRVHVLVRKDGLADTMSRYLIRRIEETPSIVLRTLRMTGSSRDRT